MDNSFLPENEYKEFEDRRYINPSLVSEQTNSFIDNLRQIQQANNQQIATQTRNLGTNISSNLGGLTGGHGYFTSRYQTPQTNSAVANLRATMQAKSLEEALANEKAVWDKRYQEAYRNYQKRQNDKQNATTDQTTEGGIDYVDNTAPAYTTKDGGGTVTSAGMQPGSSRIAYSMDGYIYAQDTLANGEKVMAYTDDPMYVKGSDGYYHRKTGNPTISNLGAGPLVLGNPMAAAGVQLAQDVINGAVR